MATRVIDDSKLNDIAVAIQAKDNGGQMTVDEMPDRIEALQVAEPVVENPALALMDWEGTILKEYSKEDALALIELPNPSSLSKYADVDHELLTFQGWNWALSDIKTWINNHKNKRLEIGASYNTTDGQDHSYWNYSRINNIANAVSIKKHAVRVNAGQLIRNYKFIEKTTIPYGVENLFAACVGCACLQFLVVPNSANKIDSISQDNYGIKSIILPNGLDAIGDYTFRGDYNLKKIIIPDTVETLGANIFRNCFTLEDIVLSKNITILNTNAFNSCYALPTVDLPNSLTNIRSYVFYACSNLLNVIIRGKPNLENVNSFQGTNANLLFYVSQSDLSWFETATNWSTFYAQNKIVTIEDNIEYLESIGIDVDEYKGVI